MAAQHSSEQPWGLLIAGKRAPLPLKAVSVQAHVKGYVLGLVSTLKYSNDSSDPIEVLFRFPVEQSQAVVGLTAVIDGRKIKAQVREKGEARAVYDDAIASGQSAALGEEKSGDVFSISLGNLPPQKEAEIQLQLVGELPIDAEGRVRFSLPSTLKPRYTPTGSSDPLVPLPCGEGEQVEHAKVSGVYGFQLKVVDAGDIAEVTSPTHTLSVASDDSGEQLLVSLSEEKPLNKDMVILIKHKDPHTPKALVEGGVETPGRENTFMSSPAAMIMFFPEFADVEAACEFIFLVDRSGSMSGSYIRSASETLVLFLKSLPEGSFFNIIGFGSSYKKLFSNSVAYSQETLDKATAHAQKMQADLGGTELLAPLEHIFTSLKTLSGLPRQIFVLTDGSVSNTNACIQKVKQNIHNARCFTFGIGSGASTTLVEGLARAGNGTAEFVKEGERMQPKVIRSLKRALQPAVTDVSVEFKVPPEFEVLQSPKNLPPVFNGEKMVVYAIIKQQGAPVQSTEVSGTAVLKGSILGKVVEHSVSFTFLCAPTEAPALPSIHHLAGKALIRDWEDDGKSKEEIVKLNVNSSVISSHTAFITVDEESTEPVSGAMKTWDVQVQRMPCSGGISLPQSFQAQCLPQSLQTQVAEVKALMHENIQRTVERGDCLEGVDECVAWKTDASVFQKKKSGGFFSSVGSLFWGLFGSKETSSTAQPSEQSTNNELLMASSSASSSVSSLSPQVQKPGSPSCLSSFITIQQANGSWKLDSSIAQLLGKSLKDLEEACPIECQGTVATVWATILVLTLLRLKYSSQQEEWELVAMKAESWVKHQTLPSGISLEDLYKASEKVISS